MSTLVYLLSVLSVTYGFGDVFKHLHNARTSSGKEIETVMTLNSPTLCDPNVKQYSGYLDADGRNQYFFWFFESRKSPESAPLVMWLTGGPGCSSELALVYENGPCKVNPDGATTTLNPYSWNNNANLLFVDQPPKTGFSTGKAVTNEDEVADDMWAFLQNFASQFPEYFENGFFVIGESYGGHYVPNVVNKVWSENKAGSGSSIPITGFAIGNGLTEPVEQFKYYAQMAYNSSSALVSPFEGIPISESLYNTMVSNIDQCIEGINSCNSDEGTSSACKTAYDECMSTQVQPVTETGVNPYNLWVACGDSDLCYDMTAQVAYFNNATVQEQLGVNQKWETCDRYVNIRLTSDWMVDYQSKVIGPIEDGVRGLIYAGDLDFICNWLGNQAWALGLPWAGKDQFNAAPMVSWKLQNGTAAGEIRQAENLSNFTFLRIYEAGHMVPLDQPVAALQMLEQFLSNELTA